MFPRLTIIPVTDAFIPRLIEDAQSAGTDIVLNKSTLLPADYDESFRFFHKAGC